tara:strand:+ start:947 stop:1486 length:540 start_codon:yes stop_codon:yes gene_type:complete
MPKGKENKMNKKSKIGSSQFNNWKGVQDYKTRQLDNSHRILTYQTQREDNADHHRIVRDIEVVEFRVKIKKSTQKLLDMIQSYEKGDRSSHGLVLLSYDIDFYEHSVGSFNDAHYQYNLGYDKTMDKFIDFETNEFVWSRYKCLEKRCCGKKLDNIKKGLNPRGIEYTQFNTGGYDLND